MYTDEYKDCLEYIDSYWNKIIHKPKKMAVRGKLTNNLPYFKSHQHLEPNYGTVEIPYAFIVPNDKKFNYIFYWDTYFMFRGVMDTKHQWIMKNMVDNFIFLFNKYGIIPNFSAPASLGRSQPPFLTSMILDTYLCALNGEGKGYREKIFSRFFLSKEKEWFERAFEIAKREYETVWLDAANLYNHRVDGYSLARYGDRDVGYAHSSELESGWDFTSRFYNRCNHFLPIDLNTLLFKYEQDFAYVAQLLDQPKEAELWQEKAAKRKSEINNLMWDDERGFYFDYGWFYKKPSDFFSLAGYVPLWAGLATYEQAQKMVLNLKKFESQYGLTITAKESLAKPIDLSKIQRRYHPAIEEIIRPKQWDYPHIWAPLEYLTVIGLLRYGFKNEAKRIMKASIEAHASLFRKYGTFFEKLNAKNGEPGLNFHYENQTGFGWTNAVFYRYIQILDTLESNEPLYKESASQTPPFTLTIHY